MASPNEPGDLVARVQSEIERSLGRVRNGLKLLGGAPSPAVGQTPRDLVWQQDKVCLYRYRSDQRRYGPPLMLVMSLVSKPYILDLRPGGSFVEVLLAHGLDVFMLDWGIPDHRESANTFETYCDELMPEALEVVCEETGEEDASLLGYCFGGNLALLYAAGHLDGRARNLAVVATPIDFRKIGPMAAMIAEGRLDPEDVIDETGNVPADVIVSAFRMLQPLSDLSSQVNLWDRMWDQDYVDSHQIVMGWAHDQIPFPGGVFRQSVQMLTRDNAMIYDTLELGGRHISIGDIRIPFLSVVALNDHITPVAAVAPLMGLIHAEDKTELRLDARHVGLVTGRTATTRTMPAMAGWIVERSGPPIA